MELAQTLPKTISIELADGRAYTFSEMNWNVQAQIENEFELFFVPDSEEEISRLGTFLGKEMRHTATLIRIAWFLLQENHPQISSTEVGNLVNATNAHRVMAVIVQRIMESLPLPEEKKKEMVDLLHPIVSANLHEANGTASSSLSSLPSAASPRRKSAKPTPSDVLTT